MVVEQEFEENLVNYLKNNGVTEIPNDKKETLQLLKRIVFNSRVNIDCIDMAHTKEVAKGIKDPEYINNIHNLELNVYNGLYYISNVNGIIREEKKLAKKSKIKKLFRIK